MFLTRTTTARPSHSSVLLRSLPPPSPIPVVAHPKNSSSSLGHRYRHGSFLCRRCRGPFAAIFHPCTWSREARADGSLGHGEQREQRGRDFGARNGRVIPLRYPRGIISFRGGKCGKMGRGARRIASYRDAYTTFVGLFPPDESLAVRSLCARAREAIYARIAS
jgi:hypothetical protein